MVRPSDALVIPKPEFRSDLFGWSDPTRSDRARYRIHGSGYIPSFIPGCARQFV